MDFIRKASLVAPPPVTTSAILTYVRGIYARELHQRGQNMWKEIPEVTPENVKDFPIDVRGWRHSIDFRNLTKEMSEWPGTRQIRVMWNPSTDDLSQLAKWDSESKTLLIQYQLPGDLTWKDTFEFRGKTYGRKEDVWALAYHLDKAIERGVTEAMIAATMDMFNVAAEGAYQWGLSGKPSQEQYDPELARYLDPAMFYVLLKNEIEEFRTRTKHLRSEIIGKTKQSEYTLALNIFVGNTKKLHGFEAASGAPEWEYTSSPFFVALRDHDPERWKKAVAELVKRVKPPAEPRPLRYKREEKLRRLRLMRPKHLRHKEPGAVPLRRERPEELPKAAMLLRYAIAYYNNVMLPW